jgi:hypothetical protein
MEYPSHKGGAMREAKDLVTRAKANYDEATFRKWFGQDTSQLPDASVKFHFAYIEWLLEGGDGTDNLRYFCC